MAKHRPAAKKARRRAPAPPEHGPVYWSTDKLHGYAIRGTDGTVGHVSDFYFDDQEWTVQYLVVDTGPWLLVRRVLLTVSVLGRPLEAERQLTVSLTKDQIRNSPDIDLHEPVSRRQLMSLHDYYGWPLPIYWGDMALPGQPVLGVYPPHIPADTEYGSSGVRERTAGRRARRDQAAPHLRSIQEVTGYHIHAKDGRIGHVEDFYIDEDRWAIRYLLADTSSWLSGKKVLIAPEWIERISWSKSEVITRLTREEIETSPEHDPSSPITPQEEQRLYAHYGES